MKKYIICCCLLVINLSLCGQSDIDLNNHWLWRLDNNPATIKNNGAVEFDLLGRYQWAGFSGAPQTYIASGTGFFSDFNSGLGFLYMVDVIGFTQKNIFKSMYSYTFSLGRSAKQSSGKTSMLTLGISGGINQNSIAHDKIKIADDVINPDIITYYVEDRKINPEIDFGFTYTLRPQSANYLNPEESILQIGASITHLNRIFKADNYGSICNYYAFATGNIPFGQMRIIPGVSFVNRGNITSAEINAMLIIPKQIPGQANKMKKYENINAHFWLGGSLKFRGNEIALFAGLDITENIGIGYSADFTYSSVGNKSRTSHELMLIFRIPNRRDQNCSSYSHDRKKTKYNAMFNNFVI
jgi:type IX secretion system PorP/SprF family membrane protein